GTTSPDNEKTIRTGVAHPTKVFLLFHVSFDEFAIGPVAHRGESHFALHELLDGLIPSQGGMVRIQIVLHFREILHRLLHLGIVPLHFAAEQIRPTLWSKNSKKRVLKELGGGPDR